MAARRFLFVLAAAVFFAAFAFQLGLHATRTSATIDEAGHVLAGYRHLTCGDFTINPHHPPLLKIVAALPLLSMQLRDPLGPCSSTAGASTAVTFDAGHRFLLLNGVDRLMLAARSAAVVFSLALAILVFAAARAMFGDVAALIALAVLAFEPTLIAHGSLVTNDMALTATLFATVFALHRFREHPTTARLLLVGVAAGLTVASKHSGIVVLPILVLFLFRRLRALATAIGIAVLVLVATYGFRWEPYVEGFRLVLAGGERAMYLFGRAYPSGRWFYFPVVFWIKASLIVLVLLPFALWSRRALLLVPPALFLALSMFSGLNIGVRHILPIWPFLLVAGAGAAWTFARDKRAVQLVLVALLLFHAINSAATAPNYISFANELWGGHDASRRIFRDSNVEWGQNLKIVREWVQREGITECWFASYGHGALSVAEQPCRLLPAFAWSTGQLVEPIPRTIHGAVLLSATTLPPRGGPEYTPILTHKPIAILGGSVLVYRGTFDVPHLSAISHATRALQLVSRGHQHEALLDAQIAVQLAPNDPRTKRALAAAQQ